MDKFTRNVEIAVYAQGPDTRIEFSSYDGIASITVTPQRGGQPSSTDYFSAAELRVLASELVRLAEFTDEAE
jgi:hypothetical protein